MTQYEHWDQKYVAEMMSFFKDLDRAEDGIRRSNDYQLSLKFAQKVRPDGDWTIHEMGEKVILKSPKYEWVALRRPQVSVWGSVDVNQMSQKDREYYLMSCIEPFYQKVIDNYESSNYKKG